VRLARIEMQFPLWRDDPEFQAFYARVRRHAKAAP
jgi:hypothetical protein